MVPGGAEDRAEPELCVSSADAEDARAVRRDAHRERVRLPEVAARPEIADRAFAGQGERFVDRLVAEVEEAVYGTPVRQIFPVDAELPQDLLPVLIERTPEQFRRSGGVLIDGQQFLGS